MKMRIRKYSRFPYATHQNKRYQPWNPLAKSGLSPRAFCVDYGRSVRTRVLWQVALPSPQTFETPVQKVSQPSQSQLNTYSTDVTNFPEFQQPQGLSLKHVTPVNPLQHPWTVFRSLMFSQMWFLKTPTIAPGVAWPHKAKKYSLAKMAAFRGLRHLMPAFSKSVLLSRLQKLWFRAYNHAAGTTQPAIWTWAAHIDSLKTLTLWKSGWAVTPTPLVSRVQVNGFLDDKIRGYAYPADLIQVVQPDFLARLWTQGPRKRSPVGVKDLFGWLASFHGKDSHLMPVMPRMARAGARAGSRSTQSRNRGASGRSTVGVRAVRSSFFHLGFSLEHRQAVRLQILILTCVGSNPAAPVFSNFVIFDLKALGPTKIMAQKVSSRSLRSQQYHGTDLALYSEHAYADLWQQACSLASQGQMFAQQNQTYKKRRKATKRRPKKYRLPGFLLARWALAYRTNALQLSPIFMKFDEQSLAHKYNPIKAVYKRNAGVRSGGRRDSFIFHQSFFHSRKDDRAVNCANLEGWFLYGNVGSNPSLSDRPAFNAT